MDLQWLCPLLGALLVVTLVVTLVGHGIWVLIARLLSPRAPHAIRSNVPLEDPANTEAQLKQLLYAGLIDPATHQKVVLALEVMRQRRAPSGPPRPVLPLVAQPLPAAVQGPAGAAAGPPVMPVPARAVAVTAPPPRKAPVPPRPRRSFSQVISAFMRVSNIRWGELVGGLLIVGCSIALVISFWSDIAGRPFYQFGIFTTVTAALLGLGLYAEHRWRLPTTSRGLLLIGTLLVPLNFVAFAALSHGGSVSLRTTAPELGALALFAFLVWRTSGVLDPYRPSLMSAGVLGISASILLARHIGPARSAPLLIGLAALPIACYGSVIGAMLAPARRWRQIHGNVAEAMLLLLGIVTFAAAVALALIVFQTGNPLWSARRMAPLLGLAPAPALSTGLLLWRKATDRRIAGIRTAGTAIALAACFAMIGPIALAWPDPAGMLPLALIEFGVLSGLAIAFEIPVAHGLAGACLIFAYLIGFHLVRHHVGWTSGHEQMLNALLSGEGGPGLVPLFGFTGSITLLLYRRRSPAAAIYAWITGCIAAVSLSLVTWRGFARHGDPYGATWVYLAYALAGLAAAGWLRRRDIGAAAWLLLLAAFSQFEASRGAPLLHWSTALLAYGTIAALACVIARRWREGVAWLTQPALWMSLTASAAAAGVLGAQLSFATAAGACPRGLWVAAIWLTIAIEYESIAAFVAAQLIIAIAVALGIIARLAQHAWFAPRPQSLLEPWTIQSLGVAMALLCLGWALLRKTVPRRLALSSWLESEWSFERVVGTAMLAVLAALALYAAVLAVNAEFSTSLAPPTVNAQALHAAGAGAWAMLGLLTALLVLWSWEGAGSAAVLLLVVLVGTGCLLWSARWAAESAGASALRWSLASFLLVACIPLWLRPRLPHRLAAAFEKSEFALNYRLLLTVLAAAPVLGLSVYPAAVTLDGLHIWGPAKACFFGRIGNSFSYTVPLLLVAAVFIGHALRERSSGWAAAAAGVCNLTATLGYALAVVKSGLAFDFVHAIRLLQLNIIVAAGFALLWMVVRWVRHRSIFPGVRTPDLLKTQIVLTLIGDAILLVPAAAWLFAAPRVSGRYLVEAGSPLGWLALLASLAAAWCAGTLRLSRLSVTGITASLWALALMPALSAASWPQNNWLSYHLMMAGGLGAAVVMPGIGAQVRRLRRGWAEAVPGMPSPVSTSQPIALQYQRTDGAAGAPVQGSVFVGDSPLEPAVMRAVAVLSGWIVLLCTRAMLGDPQRPFWSAEASLLLSLIWIGLACWTQGPRLLYAGGLLVNLAVTFWCFDRPLTPTGGMLELFSANVAVLGISGLAALVLHLRWFGETAKQAAGLPPFHRFAAALCTIGVAFISAVALWDLGVNVTWPCWAAAGAAALLVAAEFCDAEAQWTAPKLYCIGLAAAALFTRQLGGSPDRPQLWWAMGLSLAGFVLLTGALHGCRDSIRRGAARVGLPVAPNTAPLFWLAWANLALAATVTCLAYWADVTFTAAPRRLSLASLALAQFLGLCLAFRRDPRTNMRSAALLVAAAAPVAFAWAWMPWYQHGAIDKCVAAMAALTVVGIGCGLLPGRRRLEPTPWTIAAKAFLPGLGAAWILTLLAAVGLELSSRLVVGIVEISPVSISAVIAAILGAAAGAILVALMPQLDPLRLPQRYRGAYVYSAEALLALLLVHLRLTVPRLFGGVLSQYWPLVVMALAYGGVALSALLRRRGTLVLADPLFRSGAFLPLLPVIAFWAAPSRVELSNLLFAAGVFYAILSAARRSFVWGVLAALAANAGLWALLARHPQLAFLIHPQLWLVPAALSVLFAAQLNRDRLAQAQTQFVRYVALMVVYVSSTADIFLNGVAHHPWLPLVLAGLSVAGVMSGILFRLRAFLFLGTAFLALATVTMIYYASANLGWTWLWYVAGIALGAAIIATFAVFEKKRAEMLALMDGLKRWG